MTSLDASTSAPPRAHRALQFDGPGQLSVVDREVSTPADWVSVSVIATGICGTDAHGFTGDNGRRVAGQVMGHETVGRVLGDDVVPENALVTFNPVVSCGQCADCRLGETQACSAARVIGVHPDLDGGFAEIVRVPRQNLVLLPETMTVEHGALVEPLAVGYHAVMRGEPSPVDDVLIIGGGPIGQAAAIAAQRTGVRRVLVSEPTQARRAVLDRLGFATTTPTDIVHDVADHLGGAATLVVDAVGNDRSIEAALDLSTKRSRVVLVGMGARTLQVSSYQLSVGERTITGSYCYSESAFRSTAEWVAAGRPELDLLIDRTEPLSAAVGAFTEAAAGSAVNKILLTPLAR